MAQVMHISSTTNERVKHWAKLRVDASYRQEQRQVILSGKTLVKECSLLVPLKALIVREDIDKRYPAEEVITASEQVLKKISGLENPDGYAAVIEMPLESNLKTCKKIVALDGVADPGNLGTIIRSALAFGWDGIYMLPGTCDPFNDKALRAARGAQLSIQIGRGSADELKALCLELQLSPIVADLEGTLLDDCNPSEKMLLVLGNEGRGVDRSFLDWCRPVTIPMSGKMESLNVSIAGSILMYRFKS